MPSMKRLLGLKKKKPKVKNDGDLAYRPPSMFTSDANGRESRPQHANGDDHSAASDVTESYRRIRAAYADTIDPALSNEDGMGGGGGRLRSRSGRVRGSAGTKYRGNLVPAFERAPGAGAAATSPNSAVTSTLGRDRYDAYERLMSGGGTSALDSQRDRARGGERDETWRPIPEQPRDGEGDNKDIEGGSSNGDVAQPIPLQTQRSSRTDSVMGEALSQQGMPGSMNHNPPSRRGNWPLDPIRSLSPKPPKPPHSPESRGGMVLQPDAIYVEHYGDAYVDGLIKYLYPEGYQSMRPRSGPWKLSIFIFCLFLWLSVFIVGHCYDRGRKEYDFYYDNVDDAALYNLDDDAVVMETRWCGSKPLYFLWLVSVWITVLAMSYCSIIGYVKVRDVAVANGRSQPPGISNERGRSDYYVAVENANTSGSSDAGDGEGREASGAPSSAASSEYASYQDGSRGRRYAPSIYQSDGTPQFWGGHIYRPTQAAVAMTNRP